MAQDTISKETLELLLSAAFEAGKEEGHREGWRRGYRDGQYDEAARRGDLTRCKALEAA